MIKVPYLVLYLLAREKKLFSMWLMCNWISFWKNKVRFLPYITKMDSNWNKNLHIKIKL